MLDDVQYQRAFGKFIRDGREKQHLYQSQVAEMLGKSRQYYTSIETGTRPVDLVAAIKICEVLHLKMSDFISSYIEYEEPRS